MLGTLFEAVPGQEGIVFDITCDISPKPVNCAWMKLSVYPQVPACLVAERPLDCPKKRAGFACSPARSGIFHVLGKPIVLHVGDDVQNALSCMIQADGLLMGCSTFGQVAGLLSKGISFFSMHCSGGRTTTQYKTIPPLAIAERGHLWVPVYGSWRDPVLTSTDILSSTLDTYISARNAASPLL